MDSEHHYRETTMHGPILQIKGAQLNAGLDHIFHKHIRPVDPTSPLAWICSEDLRGSLWATIPEAAVEGILRDAYTLENRRRNEAHSNRYVFGDGGRDAHEATTIAKFIKELRAAQDEITASRSKVLNEATA